MNCIKFLALCTLSAIFSACGSSEGNSKLSEDAKEGYEQFFIPAKSLSRLPTKFKIVDRYDSGYLAVSTDQEKHLNLSEQQLGIFPISELAASFSQYTFPTMEAKVKELAKNYSSYATLDVYATSTQGRPQYVLSLTDKSVREPKSELMITAATHGNEIATVDTVLGLSELLLKGQASDERLQKMLREHVIHVIPAVCVDSYVARTRSADGRDPNRDYPYPKLSERKSVKCIADIISFFNAHDIVGTLDFHNAASMVFFPWAYTYDHIPQPDYGYLDQLTTEMSSQNGFDHGQISSTIYVAAGSSADYYYWKHHSAATAIELSHNLTQNAKSVDDLVKEVTHSTWTFIEGANWR